MLYSFQQRDVLPPYIPSVQFSLRLRVVPEWDNKKCISVDADWQ